MAAITGFVALLLLFCACVHTSFLKHGRMFMFLSTACQRKSKLYSRTTKVLHCLALVFNIISPTSILWYSHTSHITLSFHLFPIAPITNNFLPVVWKDCWFVMPRSLHQPSFPFPYLSSLLHTAEFCALFLFHYSHHMNLSGFINVPDFCAKLGVLCEGGLCPSL